MSVSLSPLISVGDTQVGCDLCDVDTLRGQGYKSFPSSGVEEVCRIPTRPLGGELIVIGDGAHIDVCPAVMCLCPGAIGVNDAVVLQCARDDDAIGITIVGEFDVYVLDVNPPVLLA